MNKTIVGMTKDQHGRARIIVQENVCAYCGSPIDPRDPGSHVGSCVKHPAYRYKQALERLLQRVDEIEQSDVLGFSNETIHTMLHEATVEARREAFGPTWMRHRNGED